MYCKNCGNEMHDQAVVCVKCGVAAGQGASFCQNCGATTTPGANVCVQCGVALQTPVAVGEQKSKIAAGLLGIFLGVFGVHNFYLGYTGKALAQLLITVLSCFTLAIVSEIWGLIEGIQILTGSISTDAKGVSLKD